MTPTKLQDAALARFAVQGYESTTLQEIASDVGLAKPSIYTHFKSKDELYLSLIPILIDLELNYARSVITGGKGTRRQIYQYLSSISQRFNSSYHMKFWIRSFWMPPVHLESQVLGPFNRFMESLEEIIRIAILHSPLIENDKKMNAATLANICMCFIDCLQSELLYGGDAKYQRRLKTVWKFFNSAVRLT